MSATEIPNAMLLTEKEKERLEVQQLLIEKLSDLKAQEIAKELTKKQMAAWTEDNLIKNYEKLTEYFKDIAEHQKKTTETNNELLEIIKEIVKSLQENSARVKTLAKVLEKALESQKSQSFYTA